MQQSRCTILRIFKIHVPSLRHLSSITKVHRSEGDPQNIHAFPSIFLSPSINLVPFDKNHFLVVSSNKLTPKFYIIYLLKISIYLIISSVAGGGKGSDRSESRCLKMGCFHKCLRVWSATIFSSLPLQSSNPGYATASYRLYLKVKNRILEMGVSIIYQ